MRLLSRLWPSAAQPVASAASRPDASRPSDREGSQGRPSGVRRAGPLRGSTLSRLGRGVAIAALATAGILFVTWNADYWLLRDRLVHITDALFGTYIPPECRKDSSQCIKDPETGRLVPKPKAPAAAPARPEERRASIECQGPEGLALHCQLHALFDHFNAELFDGRLPKALITLQRKEGAGGFYWHQRFKKAEGGRIDEIALNPAILGRASTLFLASILVHEMVHMEQAYFGKPGKGGFHNAEWGEMMKRVGLHPSTTGKPGGKETGTRMSHYVIPGGPFERAAAKHPILKNERLAFYE